MLCPLCSSIDVDQLTSKDGIKHHISFSELCKSAELGCELCALIRDCQEKEKNIVKPNSIRARTIEGQSASSTQVSDRAQTWSITRWDPESQITIECRRHEDGRLGPVMWLSQKSRKKPGRCFWGGCLMSVAADDPLASSIQHRPISRDPASKGCFALASGWLKTCLDFHGDCSSTTDPQYLPTRVIDVGQTDDAVPRLLVTKGARGQWITLSHCWGKVQPLRTTVDTLESHQVHLPPDKIPQLFKDAIRITRHFKQRFLWIDSLCIVQDCTEDWQNESTNMGYIYKNSFLTIAAETTGDSTESILDPSLTERHIFCPTVSVLYHSPSENITGQLLLRKNVRIADMIRGPLSRRAWTLQEDVLSPRVLRWTKQQIRWQCRTADCTEELPSGVPNNNRDLNHGRFICLPPELLAQRRSEASATNLGAGFMDVPGLWYYIVNDFASRSLTYDTDKFAAISGLAREVQKHTLNDYRAGLWVQDIHRGLLWYTSPAGSRPNVYVAPSWSWASVNTQPNTHRNVWSLFHPLLKPYKGAGRFVKIAEVLEVDVNNTVADVFSQITSGHLTIKGPCFRAESLNTEIFIRARQPIVTGDKIFEHQDVKQGTMLYRLDISSDLTKEEMLTGSVVIQIARMEGQTTQKFPGMIYGLLCKAVIEADGRFQRIGITRISEEFASSDSRWRTEIITIV